MFMLFPCHTEQAKYFYQNQSSKFQENIVACSSIETENIVHKFNKIVYLPNIYDEDFLGQLDEVVAKYQIITIITDNDFIAQHLCKINYPLPVISIARNFCSAINEFKELKVLSYNYHQHLQEQSKESVKITPAQILNILNTCVRVPGQTTLDKLLSFIKIFGNLPEGDVLEIGVLFGRSAIALSLLSKIYFEHNRVFLVDPWDVPHSIQEDSSELLIQMAKELDWNTVFERFKAEIASTGLTNYQIVRGTCGDLKQNLPSEKIGTKFLSLAHIDGNHDYNVVKNDLLIVLAWLKPNGIIICDDYKWIHGQGVKRAVTELLSEYTNLELIENFIDNSVVIRVK